MVFKGEHSEKSCVKFGVPHGIVLDPLCFWLFVNDIGQISIKLFADDTLLSGLLHNFNDLISLQSDLDKAFEWARLWQMVFSPSKCCVLRVCRNMNPLIHPMPGQTLQSADLDLLYQWIWSGGHIFWTLEIKLILHLALSRGTYIVAHRRLKIKLKLQITRETTVGIW